jgi:uncharacterized protein YbjT (DUF2867 family)
MRVAITGGTGFVGGHLAASLSALGNEVVIISRGHDQRPMARSLLGLSGITLVHCGTNDLSALTVAFSGCDAVAHCAGINRELGEQTYEAVHVQGTANVVRAAERAGVRRLVLLSFLRARPACGSAYHESKWAAEELVRASSCEWTILKPGMIYGHGDHMIDHLSHALFTFPVFIGIGPRPVRPLAVSDVVRVLNAALVDGKLPRQTVALVGPTELGFDDAARLVSRVINQRRPFIRLPVAFHYVLAWVSERTMKVPLVALAQVRILREGDHAVLAPDQLNPALAPSTPFNEESIRASLPPPGRFGLNDLRWFESRQHSRPV